MVNPSISAFLSYSDKDKKTAKMISKEFAKFGIDVFLAHEDVQAGDVWRNVLFHEIKNRDLFIILLTENYRHGDYTNHECGMAIAYEKSIIPIRIGGASLYGLIEQYQNVECRSDKIVACVKEIAKSVVGQDAMNIKTRNFVVKEFCRNDSYEIVKFYARQLQRFDLFTKKQINDIGYACMKNPHIRDNKKIRSTALDILKENYYLMDNNLKKNLGILYKRRTIKKPQIQPKRGDRYAIYQDLWNALDIKIHSVDCTFVPSQKPASTKWFFTTRFDDAVDMAKGLGKEREIGFSNCKYCKPSDRKSSKNPNYSIPSQSQNMISENIIITPIDGDDDR